MTASTVSAWGFFYLEIHVQVKYKFFIAVWKPQTVCRDDSIPLVQTRLLYSIMPENCQSLAEVWAFLLEPQAAEDGDGGAQARFVAVL